MTSGSIVNLRWDDKLGGLQEKAIILRSVLAFGTVGHRPEHSHLFTHTYSQRGCPGGQDPPVSLKMFIKVTGESYTSRFKL